EGDGLEDGRVEVSLRRPAVDDLVALSHRPQLDEVAGDELRRRPELLAELAQSGVEQLLALVGFALRNRPGAEVFLRPERPARVDGQALGTALDEPVKKDPGAFPHLCIHFSLRCSDHGAWRSLVAHSAGGRAVAGSNPVAPISGPAHSVLRLVRLL